MITDAISKLVKGKSLTENEAMAAMTDIMEGTATHSQIGGFLTALRIKGENIDEITGCARVMREKAQRLSPRVNYFIDTCGTGGDGGKTFNISTAVAFVAAAGGVTVAKHGNRAISSKSGSADVLEALGININLSPEQVQECIEQTGMGFMFAPVFHSSMKYAASPRRELGIRTVFNILGPLTNPAGAHGQIMGIYSNELVEPIANVLLRLGTQRALVVHGSDGLDEITITGDTFVAQVLDGKVSTYTVNPKDFGIDYAKPEALAGGDASTNAGIILDIFSGKKGPCRDIVLLNAAAALYIGKAVDSIEQGIIKSRELIDSGLVNEKLRQIINFTNSLI